MNFIQCCASTDEYNEDVKDEFYDGLQSIVEKCPTKNLTILIGDLNTKVGMDNTGYEDIMGRHGLGKRDENGERFATYVHSTTWLQAVQYSHTNAHTKINGSHRITLQRFRSAILESVENSDGQWKT